MGWIFPWIINCISHRKAAKDQEFWFWFSLVRGSFWKQWYIELNCRQLSLNLIVSAGISVLMAGDIDFGFMSMWLTHSFYTMFNIISHYVSNIYHLVSCSHDVCKIYHVWKYIIMFHDVSNIYHHVSWWI